MIEDDGALRDATADSMKTSRTPKLYKVVAGSTVAYAVNKDTFSIGKVLNVSRMEARLILQRYGPIADGRLWIEWRPLYVAEDGSEDYHGSKRLR